MFQDEKGLPLISIIVPVYKVKEYLDKCVLSIVQQTYRNIDIILVDDGSPDECGAMCDRWAEQDERIRVIHKSNGGLSDARNAGIEAAEGDYLSFIDSDDYIEPEMIERLYLSLIKYNTPLAVCNYVYEFEKSGGVEKCATKDYISDVYQIQEDSVVSCQTLTKWIEEGKCTFCVVAWNKLYSRYLFEQIRYPIGKIHEDEYVFHRIVYLSQKIACISYVGYHYLQRKDSIMGKNINYQDAMEALIDRCIFFLEKNEKEMALETERHMLGIVKVAKRSRSIIKCDKYLEIYAMLVWKYYQKRWISLTIVIKRLIRIYLINN